MKSTIYGLSTILGRSGVAVIRISGPNAKDILYKFTKRNSFIPRRAVFCTLFSPTNDEILDKIIAIYFNSPNTFTGEDIVEFHLHGSVAVIKDVLNELSKVEYIRCAEPGEFTRQAFENGKMDLIEVEALSDLIHADTTAQRRAAIYQISGHLTALYEGWRNAIISIMAQFEAYIDFPEDDIPHSAINSALDSINSLIKEIQSHLERSEKAISAVNGLSIVIGGPPNVGKSSLMNLLAQQEVSIVSNIAGTTRDILQVKMEMNGVNVTVYDTAGIREKSNDVIEIEGIKRAKTALENANIKIYVFDSLNQMQNFEIEENAIILLNKCDLNIISDNVPNNVLQFSAKTGLNLNLLLKKIFNIIEEKCAINTNEAFTTQQRQKEKLLACIDHLKSINIMQPLEITAQKIRLAVLEIEYIIGKVTLNDVLNKIFSTFCIGK